MTMTKRSGVYYALSLKSIYFSDKAIRLKLLGASGVYNCLQVVQ
jgi:hypothetical protein